jgi:hypothetical protein
MLSAAYALLAEISDPTALVAALRDRLHRC